MPDMYEIKKDIPVPPKRKSLFARFPWNEMKVGDCFDIPLTKSKHISSSPYASLRFFNKRNKPIKITVRKITENNIARVWRIE